MLALNMQDLFQEKTKEYLSLFPNMEIPLVSWWKAIAHFDGLVQEWHNSSALAMELRLSCTNPLIYSMHSISQMLKTWSTQGGRASAGMV